MAISQTILVILCTAALLRCQAAGEGEGEEAKGGLARGWGDSIAWRTLAEGKEIAASQGKPLMLIIHKSWCGACQALRPMVEKSKELEAMSEHFVMVNALDNEEPQEKEFSPDGGYIPRILFLSSEGEVQPQYYNEVGSNEYKYFYATAEQIVQSMKKVVGMKPEDEVKTEL